MQFLWRLKNCLMALPILFLSTWVDSTAKSSRTSRESNKNMETIYWTCGGVANMVNIIIVRLNSFFLGSHNSQEVTLPRKSQLPCAITFSSSHYPPLHLDWPHAPKKVDPSNYTGPMPPKSFKPGYRSKWQFYRNFEKTYIMTEVPQ